MVKHDSLKFSGRAAILATGLAYTVLSSFRVKGQAIFMETVHTHFAATRKSHRVVKYAEDDTYPNIRVLLGIGCTPPVSFAEAELLSFILWLATNQDISQKQDA